MKLLIDAHFPKRLANQLSDIGYDVIHTRDLIKGNRTTDAEMNTMSLQESRIVVTKDSDFVNSFITQGRPYKLLLVSTGNISNWQLSQLFLRNINLLDEGFSKYRFIEINQNSIIYHE
jgi:predicted nuclease of predicted toxin-antitoxin system